MKIGGDLLQTGATTCESLFVCGDEEFHVA